MTGFRIFKHSVRELLLASDWEDRLEELTRLPLKKALGPLFSFLCDLEPLVKWRAVTAFGEVVHTLAQQDMEAARMIMRRLMWSLNEESGAIGWGAPEAMGECLARNRSLAKEYHRILISYAREPERGDGNYLEHVPLLRGAYWGLARLAEARPDLVQAAMPAFLEGVGHDDPQIRGLSVLALGQAADVGVIPHLQPLFDDAWEIDLYRNRVLKTVSIASLAREALDNLAA